MFSLGAAGRAVLLALWLVASSAGCVRVVASSVVLLAAAGRGAAAGHGALLVVVGAGGETSSGWLTAGDHLGLVAAALELRGEAFARRSSLLLVQIAAGVGVSAAVALGHRLGLGVAADVDCGCHCSLFDGCLSAILRHRSAHDAQMGLLSLGLGRLLAAAVGKRDRRRAGCSSG